MSLTESALGCPTTPVVLRGDAVETTLITGQYSSDRTKEGSIMSTYIKDRLAVRGDYREDFSTAPQGTIPAEGLKLGHITLSYVEKSAYAVAIGTCEFDAESQFVTSPVLQSVTKHDPFHVRIDFHEPCASVFFIVFAWLGPKKETVIEYFSADNKSLQTFRFPAGQAMNDLVEYAGETPTTSVVIRSGGDVFIDNVDLTLAR
jgi:hypothetical protein